jgi:colicin import membrane protein
LKARSPKNSEEVVVPHKIADLALKIAKAEASYEEETPSWKAVEEARKKQAEEMAESSRKKAEEDARKRKAEEEARKKMAGEEAGKKANAQRGLAKKPAASEAKPDTYRQNPAASEAKLEADAAVTAESPAEDEEVARKIDEAAQMSGKQRGITLSPVFDVAKARATQVANAAEVISNFYDAWGVKRSSEDIAILSMQFLEVRNS